jgi:phosphatidylserine/phosphatidylglycerophosphate/cardiolipin synthase-like enzyme
MFMPGDRPLGTIVRKQQAGLYVRGVTNEYVSSARAVIGVHATGSTAGSFTERAPDPRGVDRDFGYWLKELQKNALGVLVHSKVIVVDPLGADPAVVVGSHNFSGNASKSNDENFLVIRGNAALARAYATHIVGVYQHYRWRQYLASARDPWSKLSRDPAWQGAYDSPKERAERAFWAG